MPVSHLTRSDLEALLPEPILTVEEVAGRLRRHPLTVVRAINRGALELERPPEVRLETPHEVFERPHCYSMLCAMVE